MNPLSEDFVANVVEALRRHGFTYRNRDEQGWIVLTGALNAAGEAYPCVFAFDPLCIDIPRIQLREVPSSLKPIAPHISQEGALCYIAEGTISLDVCDPVGQTLACLKRAEEVFAQILNKEMVEDLVEEFSYYWNQGEFCFSDISAPGRSKPVAFGAIQNDILWVFISDDEARTRKKLKLGGVKGNFFPISVVEIETEVQPSPRTDFWPPKDVKDILAWQGRLDSRTRKKIENKLLEACKSKPTMVLFVISSPLIRYAFAVSSLRKESGQKSSRPIRKEDIYPMSVSTLHVYPIDNPYIIRRNIPGVSNLMDKHIALVGCGTIGGYLSELLVKMGAGSGRGSLALIDNDSLHPQNIGRHRLGMNYLLKYKADALQTEFGITFPGAQIAPYVRKAQDVDFRNFDLVINATGEEALGHWLSAKLSSTVPLLTVWIEGPGVAVRGLLRSPGEGACFRCLKEFERDGQLRSVFEELPKIFAGQGCEGAYVPFPAFVSSHAANLAAEMVLDWANNLEKSRLITRVTDSDFTLATSECSPAAHLGCPICHT